MDLTGRAVLVTGGAHRLGKAIALTLARMGAPLVAFTYNSSEAAAHAADGELQALGSKTLPIRCDQQSASQIQEAISQVEREFGRLDVLVNSASVLLEAGFFEVTNEDWDTVLNVNARGPFFFMQAAAGLMQAKEGGLIINIIDESVKKPALKWLPHGASKAALWNLTRAAAIALAPGIRVNAILPGAVLKPPDWEQNRWDGLEKSIPLQKTGTPEDVCQAVEYLVRADFVTGQMIVVDGGSTAL
jgi:pteridine reductase